MLRCAHLSTRATMLQLGWHLHLKATLLAMPAGYGNQARGNAPVAALQCQEQYTFASGGSSRTHVTMWQLGTYKLLDTYDTYAYGACSALTVLQWDASPASSSVTEGVPAHTASAPAFVRGVPVPAPAWRLLSGHESGQVLLWEVVGMKLRLVAAIGEASGSPVRCVVHVVACCACMVSTTVLMSDIWLPAAPANTVQSHQACSPHWSH